MARPMVAHAGWALFHCAVAGTWLVLSCGLAFSRGLRPGGPTLRRRRTTALAVLALLGLLVVPWLPGLYALAWVTPACWAGLFWVVALNRRGASRLEQGKRAASAYLYAAAISFAVGSAHGASIFGLEGIFLSPAQWGGVGVGMVVLVGGLRVLSGPPDSGPILVAAASGGSLLFPALLWWSFDPAPDDLELPVWEDFAGEASSSPDAVDRVLSVTVVRADGTLHHPESAGHWANLLLVERHTPLDTIPFDYDGGLGVNDGRFRTPRWSRWAGFVVVSADDEGQAVLSAGHALAPHLTGPHPLDASLPAVLREATGTDHQLIVVVSPHWTAQDYVSMCASLSPPASCELKQSRPTSWP